MKKISIVTIFTIILYFLSVASFLITKTDAALTLWELFTVIGAIVYLVFFVCLSEKLSFDNLYKRLLSIFMTYTLVLTSVAHIVNITVTRRLISQGINVPDYFKIGCWPSVEMVIDYLAGILCLFGFYGALFINENLWYMAPLAYGIMQIYICIKAGKIE